MFNGTFMTYPKYYTPNEMTNPYPIENSWITTSSNIFDFSSTFESDDVTIFSEDISLDIVNILKEDRCLSIEILTKTLIDDEMKAYSYDGKFFVEFLEDSFDDSHYDVIKIGWSSPFGKLEFSFSELYDVSDIQLNHINGVLHITVPKFEKYFRKDFEINEF